MKKYNPIAVIALFGALLVGCSSAYKPEPLINKTYQAPAQAYAMDLSSQVFRGAVKLTERCDVAGSSTDFVDTESQFFRIDVVNLINNPAVELPEFADDVTVRELVQEYYSSRVNINGRVLEQVSLETTLGSALFTTTQFGNANMPYMGSMVVRRGNYAYVIQHIQKKYRPQKLKEKLLVLSQSMRIPGYFATLSPRIEGPIYVDMQNATPNEIARWRRAAKCE